MCGTKRTWILYKKWRFGAARQTNAIATVATAFCDKSFRRSHWVNRATRCRNESKIYAYLVLTLFITCKQCDGIGSSISLRPNVQIEIPSIFGQWIIIYRLVFVFCFFGVLHSFTDRHTITWRGIHLIANYSLPNKWISFRNSLKTQTSFMLIDAAGAITLMYSFVNRNGNTNVNSHFALGHRTKASVWFANCG